MTGGVPINLLYVDANSEFQGIVKAYLEKNSDIIVTTSSSGILAFYLLENNSYDILVTDYFLSDTDGPSFLAKLKKINPDIPVIIFTDQSEEKNIDEALQNGADFFLRKVSCQLPQCSELSQVVRLLLARNNSEKNLKNCELKFQTIVDYSHSWLYWIDPEGKLVYVSPSCKQITGYTPEEMYQDPGLINRMVYEEDLSRWKRHMENHTIEKGTLILDYRIVHKNGDIVWINHTCQSVFNGRNQYLGRRIGNTDISNRKKTEVFLLHERNNFLKIFSAAPVGLLLLDKDRVIREANQAIASMVLRDPADIIRTKGGEGLGCVHSTENPGGCGYSTSCPSCPLRIGIESVLKQGKSVHGEIVPLTLMINGESQVRWLNINAEPVEMDGKEYVVLAIDDVTNQKNLENSLRESEEKFRILADSTTAGIMIYQDDYWFYANPAAEKISGYSVEELLSMKFWEVIHPDYLDVLTTIGKSRQWGEETRQRHFELKIVHKNGEERWIDVVSTTVTLKGKKSGLVTAIDITDRKRTEEKLVKSEEKYRLIFENQIDLYYQTNHEGIITNLSPSCKRLTGYDPEELIGTSVLNLYPRPEMRKELIDLLEIHGIVNDYETVLKNKKGTLVFVSINSHIIRGNDGKTLTIEGTLRDITRRKQIEEALKKSEEHYRSLFHNMLEGFAYCKMLYDMDGNPVDWIYLNVNEAFERLTGLENINGKLVSEVIPDTKTQTPELFDLYNEVVVSGITKTFEIHFTPLDQWLNISVYRPESGHFVAVFEDITRRKQDEITLNMLINQYETILVNVPAMIWYKDTKNTFVKINPAAARVFGKTIPDIEGKKFPEIFPDSSDPFLADDLNIIATGKPKFQIMEKLVSASGENIWVQSDKVPLFDNEGNVFGILIVSTDITEKKRITDAISLANKKLNLLSDITRHDIVNQLQGLLFVLDLAIHDEPSPSVLSYLERANNFAGNIGRQIAFTRDYQDIGVKLPDWQNVGVIIKNAARFIDLGEIALEVTITHLEIFADPLLEKVFQNLIDNAKRYGEKITRISFSGYVQEGDYAIICADDGVGIPEIYKAGIFKREYFKHTGFGLNLSREILDITGINISENGIEGEGARFEILVPVDGWRIQQKNPAT
ncbi:MAG: PAS domain S-box protein [Methanomicrobiales archaeon]|nr:PAS domain S-box protein [Methanomicrobiales archaeon]